MAYYTYDEILEILYHMAWVETPMPNINVPVPHGTLVYMANPEFKGDYKGAVNLVLKNAAKYLPAEWYLYRHDQSVDLVTPAIAYVRKHARFFQQMFEIYELEDFQDMPPQSYPYVLIEGLTDKPIRLSTLAAKVAGYGEVDPDTLDFDGRQLRQAGYGEYVLRSLVEWNQAVALRFWQPEEEEEEEEDNAPADYRDELESAADALLGERDHSIIYDNDYRYRPWQGIPAGLRAVEISDAEALAYDQQCLQNRVYQVQPNLNGPCHTLSKKEAKEFMAWAKKQEREREAAERKMVKLGMRVRK